jgi:hypothetical protein
MAGTAELRDDPLERHDLHNANVDEAAAQDDRCGIDDLRTGRVCRLRARHPILQPENVFRREGGTWRISFAGQEIRLHETKGLADALIRAEGRAVPSAALARLRRRASAGR